MSLKEREYHIVTVTKTSLYDASVMKTWLVSKYDIN